MELADLPPRLVAKVEVDQTTNCWVWTGAVRRKDYGAVKWKGRAVVAHRLIYILLVGPIPDGLHLDHLCRLHRCVNPAHLEPVTSRENTNRGLRGDLRTHCTNGHLTTAENTYFHNGIRYCKTCHAATRARRKVVSSSPDHPSTFLALQALAR